MNEFLEESMFPLVGYQSSFVTEENYQSFMKHEIKNG